MLGLIFIILVVTLMLFLQITLRKKQKILLPPQALVTRVLQQRVAYYSRLAAPDQLRFQKETTAFLKRVKITGIGTAITSEDRILVAASGIIAIFGFKGWQYPNLNEVLVYPDRFTHDFDFSESNEDRNILGMVGNGGMDNMMILSKPALHQGFSGYTDYGNTALHEFVHLLDKADGETNGIPSWFMDKDDILPWLQLVHHNIQAIKENNSDIDPYGATNAAEFFAVAAVYFFEKPQLFKQNHPGLHASLQKVFRQEEIGYPSQVASNH